MLGGMACGQMLCHEDILLAYGTHTPAVSVQDATYNLQDHGPEAVVMRT